MLKILIIKLGALGDVIRTTPILSAIKDKYKNSEIYWLTKKQCAELLYNNPKIKKVLILPYHFEEQFDILYNFDIEKEALNLASNIKAKEKYGFYNNFEYPTSFNLKAEYYLNTLFDDEFKKRNKKSFLDMFFYFFFLIHRQTMY